VLPPGGFLTLGALLTFFAWMKSRRDRAAQQASPAAAEERVA